MLCTRTASSLGPLSAKPTTNSCDDSRTVAVDGPVLTEVDITTPGIGPSYYFSLRVGFPYVSQLYRGKVIILCNYHWNLKQVALIRKTFINHTPGPVMVTSPLAPVRTILLSVDGVSRPGISLPELTETVSNSI